MSGGCKKRGTMGRRFKLWSSQLTLEKVWGLERREGEMGQRGEERRKRRREVDTVNKITDFFYKTLFTCKIMLMREK